MGGGALGLVAYNLLELGHQASSVLPPLWGSDYHITDTNTHLHYQKHIVPLNVWICGRWNYIGWL